MKRPLTALEMAPELMDAVHEGHKLVTIREGHRDYRQGDRLMIVCDNNDYLPFRAVVVGVTLTTLGQVDECDLRSDGFRDRTFALEGMRRFYPIIQNSSPVTVIRWRAE